MLEKKIARLDARIDELRTKVKGLDELKTSSEVFDKATLMALYHLASQGHLDILHGVIQTGKEANVFMGTSNQGQPLAVKIYRVATSNFHAMVDYLVGDPRFKSVKKNRRNIIYIWVKKEFKNLTRAHEAGVRVPMPIAYRDNVLIMEFIGEEGMPSPQLKGYKPEDLKSFYQDLEENLNTLFCKAGLIHGDLSEYNILVRDDKPVIIDVSQSVVKAHPRSEEFLLRDIGNLERFFKELKVKKEDIIKRIKAC